LDHATVGFGPVVDDGVDGVEIGVAAGADHFSLAFNISW